MEPATDAGGDLFRRSWMPVRAFFDLLSPADGERQATGFLSWLGARGLPGGLDLALGSLRQQLRGLLNLFAESTMGTPRAESVRAAEAFDALWWKGVRDRAVERMKSRCLAYRRIVPFLVYQRRIGPPRIENPADLASQLGLGEEVVLEYLREVRAGIRKEARLELDLDREPPEAVDQLPES